MRAPGADGCVDSLGATTVAPSGNIGDAGTTWRCATTLRIARRTPPPEVASTWTWCRSPSTVGVGVLHCCGFGRRTASRGARSTLTRSGRVTRNRREDGRTTRPPLTPSSVSSRQAESDIRMPSFGLVVVRSAALCDAPRRSASSLHSAPAYSQCTLLKYAATSITSGSRSASGCHTSDSTRISGSSSPGRHRSTKRAAGSTIQYSGTASDW